MPADAHSFRKLLPTFIIPPGTQVVLRVDKPLPGGEMKPRGCVAVVVESPPDNSTPYTVRFADGQTVAASFRELSLRRREVEDELAYGGTDLRPYIIYRCRVGSHAFGLATETSDDDIRGIYLPPARLHWSLYRLPEQLEFADEGGDEVYWELEKFLRLALKANPNVLETLWTPLLLHADEVAQRLRTLRGAFLSRHLYKTYSGYVISQFRRMANAQAKNGTYKAKHAMHLTAERATGDLPDWDEHDRRLTELEQAMEQAFARSSLPEHADRRAVNEMLIRLRLGREPCCLTITTTHQPATDLGYLLHKNPAGSVQSFALSFGQVHVFYPEATPERCTAALLLDVDAVGLVRNRRGPAGEGGSLEQYVNDRPYVASSFLSVAIAQVFGSALQGRCKDRPELVDAALPLEARLFSLPRRGGEVLLRRLFEPLGYTVATPGLLDDRFPEWGPSPYHTVELTATCRLQDLLSHLYVLVPVLDNDKHYWVGDAEVEKLLRHGEGWLPAHPERELIARRYLKHQRSLTDSALARLVNEDEPDADGRQEAQADEEAAVERPMHLNEQRLNTVLTVLKESGARRVLDLGAGAGKLLTLLLEDRAFEEIVGVDVSFRALEIARSRLRLDRLPPRQLERIRLLHGSLIYRDRRLEGYDAAAVIEVIEHLDPPRLRAFERVLFEFAQPGTIVLTTPNAEYNVKFESLPAGRFRHKDHRFEWTRTEFQAWANRIAEKCGYSVRFLPVGPEDAVVGSPTQMGVFQRK